MFKAKQLRVITLRARMDKKKKKTSPTTSKITKDYEENKKASKKGVESEEGSLREERHQEREMC